MSKGSNTINTVAGIVALSYLVVIPVAGYVGYKMLQEVKLDVDEMWTHFEGEPPPTRQGSVRKYLLK